MGIAFSFFTLMVSNLYLIENKEALSLLGTFQKTFPKLALKVPNTLIEVQVVGKRLNLGGGYGLEIPVIYRFYGQEKLVNWLIKKTEAVKKELKKTKFLNALNKCLENRSILSFFLFQFQKILMSPLIGQKKRAKLSISCRN